MNVFGLSISVLLPDIIEKVPQTSGRARKPLRWQYF